MNKNEIWQSVCELKSLNEKRNSNKETQSIVSTRVGENSTVEETTVVDNE